MFECKHYKVFPYKPEYFIKTVKTSTLLFNFLIIKALIINNRITVELANLCLVPQYLVLQGLHALHFSVILYALVCTV